MIHERLASGIKTGRHLFFGLECRFRGLRLRHFIAQELQHLLGGVSLCHLLAGTHSLGRLAVHSHLRQRAAEDQMTRC